MCEDHKTISDILSTNRGQILTCEDGSGYSPITLSLYYGDDLILNLIKKYINKYIQDNDKTICDQKDVLNILTVLRFPQCDLNPNDCLNFFLKPLFSNITPFTELIDSFDIND